MNRKILFFVFPVVAFILLLYLTREVPYCGWDFHNSLWGPVNMLVHHSTPYTYDTPYGPYPGVWMPPSLGFFFFMGYFPCDPVQKLWLLAEIAGMIWAIWMIADYKFPRPWILAVCLIGFFLFPPLWFHIMLGQFPMLFVTMMMMVVYLPQVKRLTPLLLVLGLTKPQLAILVYPGLVISAWRKEGFRQAAWLVLSTGILAALCTIPLFLYFPGWLEDFLFITFKNFGVPWDLPTLFVQLPARLGTAGYLIWAMAFFAAIIISLWLWSQKDVKTALIFSLAMTPMVTPYASSWDFLLLIPAFFFLTIKLKTKAARAVLLLGMVSVFIAQIAARWNHPVNDGSQWWIPPTLILVYLLSLAVEYATGLNRLSLKQKFVQ